jgi:hypothetical protein
MLWQRYRKNMLLTPISGLHLQILVFYGLGGFAFVLFPEAEPRLLVDEIVESSVLYLTPFLIGYAIACLFDYLIIRRTSTNLSESFLKYQFTPISLFSVGLLGFTGCLLEGKLIFFGLSSLLTYFKTLFFPCLIFMALNYGKYDIFGKLLTLTCFLMSIIIGIWSPWKSFLIVLMMSVMIVVALAKPKLLPYALILSVVSLLFLIPFQLKKRVDYLRFTSDPTGVFRESLELTNSERVEAVGQFLVIRINYVRELVYVNRALDSGMAVTHGSTYKSIIYQMIPRVLWPSKPELAYWSQYTLPREVGLLQHIDEYTSWAVNIFAEACYNFEKRCLIWFIPVVFFLLHGLDRLVHRSLKSAQARVLCLATLFFVLMSATNAIYLSSTIFAVGFLSFIYNFVLRSAEINRRFNL